jgi:hypothetical protein
MPGFSKLDAFFWQGNAEPVDAFLLEPLRALHGSVSIGVGFDDGHVFCVPDELFG